MLRKIRRTLAVLFFACITLLFLDFTGTLHAWLGWMARVQFLPAVLALNVGVVAVLAVLTLLFGRVYCSVVCPLGVFQDLVAWLGGRGKRRKYRFSYSPARRWLRCGTLALFVAALVAGVGSLVALLAPYSAYGRIASNFFRPVYLWGNNALAAVAERVGSYAFYETEVRVAGLPTLLIAAATCAVLVVLAWRNGRTYCNTVCPVGTVLGFLSKYALFRPVIDPEKCRDCGLCARGCKAACIDYRNRRIDYSRCVACMDCLDVCRHGAVGYRFHTKTAASVPGAAAGKRTESAAPADTGRRNFLTGTGLLLGVAVARAQERKWTAVWPSFWTSGRRPASRPSCRRAPGPCTIWRRTVRAASSASRSVLITFCGPPPGPRRSCSPNPPTNAAIAAPSARSVRRSALPVPS